MTQTRTFDTELLSDALSLIDDMDAWYSTAASALWYIVEKQRRNEPVTPEQVAKLMDRVSSNGTRARERYLELSRRRRAASTGVEP